MRTFERKRPHKAGAGHSICLGGRADLTRIAGLYGSDPRLSFIDAMRHAGIVPAEPDKITADGNLHRFRVEGDRPGSRNGWAVLHTQGIPAGAFGHWRTGHSQTWCGARGSLTPAQRIRLAAEIDKAKREREAKRLAAHKFAQDRALRLWARAATPDGSHPYLVRKAIQTHGIRQLNTLLLIPLREGDGTLWNVQTIDAEGNKRFLIGGRKRGLYHALGIVESELLIAEGYATAATLHDVTGKPVAVAFDAGNLEPVARVLRAKFPRVRITLCADNDAETDGNPGIAKATAAARAVNGHIAIPPEPFNDFNDAMTGSAP